MQSSRAKSPQATPGFESARTGGGPVARQGLCFLSKILGQVANTISSSLHAVQRTAATSANRILGLRKQSIFTLSHVQHVRSHESAFPTAVCSSHAKKGGFVAKRAKGQEGQPDTSSGSTGHRAASGQGPCPPPAQPLGTDSVVNATMILISAGAITPGSSRDVKNRQQKVTAGGGNTPNLFRQPAVGGDHKALSLSSWKVKVIQASNTRLSNDRPTVAQSPSGF